MSPIGRQGTDTDILQLVGVVVHGEIADSRGKAVDLPSVLVTTDDRGRPQIEIQLSSGNVIVQRTNRAVGDEIRLSPAVMIDRIRSDPAGDHDRQLLPQFIPIGDRDHIHLNSGLGCKEPDRLFPTLRNKAGRYHHADRTLG